MDGCRSCPVHCPPRPTKSAPEWRRRRQERFEYVLALRERGLTYREIGIDLGISQSRAGQIVRKAEWLRAWEQEGD